MSTYKFQIGSESPGTEIPRALNPLFFLASALVGTIILAFCALVMAVLVILAPVSWLWPIKVRQTA